MDDLRTAESALGTAAAGFDASVCTGREAIDLVETLGRQRRLIDGMIAKAAKRVEDTAAYTYDGHRNTGELCEKLVGVSSGEAKRAIETAAKLESLPAVDAAVRAGRLSSRQADLIVDVAAGEPSVERSLLKVAARGMVALRDECISVRARREDQAARSNRQHAARSFMMWPTVDGMVEGHFKVTPEVGGAIKAVIEDGTRKRFRAARSDGTREGQDAYAADAFADAVTGDPATAKSGGYTTHVVVDFETLQRGRALDDETCEIPGVGPVNTHWVREMLGLSFVTAIVKKGPGCARSTTSEKRSARRSWATTAQGWILGPPDPVTGKRTLSPPGSTGNEAGRAA
jgi:hypothetical protein